MHNGLLSTCFLARVHPPLLRPSQDAFSTATRHELLHRCARHKHRPWWVGLTSAGSCHITHCVTCFGSTSCSVLLLLLLLAALSALRVPERLPASMSSTLSEKSGVV